MIKAEFNIISTPEEILKVLLDLKNRCKWDYGLNIAQANLISNELELEYKNEKIFCEKI